MDAEPSIPTIGTLLAQRAWVRRLARALVADDQRADDVTQDAFAIALARPLERLRDLKPWLAATVRRLAAHQRRADARRHAREVRAARPEAETGAESALRAAELQEGVVRAVLALDEPYRSTILLRYLEEHSVEEVAQRLCVTPATVRGRTARGLEELRRRFARDQGRSGSMHALAFLAGLATLRSTELVSAPLTTLLTGGIMTKKNYGLAALLALLLLPVGLWYGLGMATSAWSEAATTGRIEAPESAAGATLPGGPGPQDTVVAEREATLLAPSAPAAAPAAPAATATDLGITGRLVRGDGRPIAGARVFLFDPPLAHSTLPSDAQRATTSTQTGPDGRYVLGDLRLGNSYGLIAQAEGFAPGYNVAAPGAREDWKLFGAGRVFGRVLDARTRTPVSGVEVATQLRHVEGNVCRAEVASRSDAQGRYSIAGLPAPFPVTLMVRPNEQLPFALNVALGAPGDLERDILVEGEAWIEGRVIDHDGGAPVPGAAVATAQRGPALARTDARGYFRVRAGRGHWGDPKDGAEARESKRPPGWDMDDEPVRIYASAEGWCTTRVRLKDLQRGQDGALTLPMLRSGGIQGRVLGANDVPLANARLTWADLAPMRWLDPAWAMPGADSMDARTDEQGRFALPCVPWGEVHVVELAVRHGSRPELRVRDVLPAGPGVVRELEIRLDQTLSLGGVAWLNEERHDAYVYVETPGGKTVTYSQADAEGRFNFAALQPGEYVVKACTSDGTMQWSPSKSLELRSQALNDVTLRIQADFGYVRGRVTKSTGEPLAEIGVIAFEEAGGKMVGPMRSIAGLGKSNVQGDFTVRLPRDEEAKYEIAVFWGQSDYSFHGVRIGREDLAFQLPELVTVELIVVEHASGLPVDTLEVAWIDPTTKARRAYYGGQEIPAAEGRLEVQVPKGVVDLLVSSPSKGLKETKVRCLGTREQDDTVERIQVELQSGGAPVKPPGPVGPGAPTSF